MNTQQRPLLAGRECDYRSGSGYDVISKLCFPLSAWIAAIMALLFFGCASLTPDRIAVLAAIAGQAAQLGAQQWLKDHPTQKPAFDLVLMAINAFVRNGETNMAKYTALLESLPTMTLRGEAGEVYIAGEPAENERGPKYAAHLVIWDKELNKAVRVTGPTLEKAVQRTIRDGLRRACAPLPPAMPPALPVIRKHRTTEPGLTGRDDLRFQPEGAVTNTTIHLPGWTHLSTSKPTNELVVEKSDAELDAEFLRIKAEIEKRNGK